MAALSSAERQIATRRLAKRIFEEVGATATYDLDTLRAVINAIDDYYEANASAMNSALPVGFRTTATMEQKAAAFAIAALRRAGITL